MRIALALLLAGPPSPPPPAPNVHRHRDDEAPPPGRSRGLPRRPVGRLSGHRGRAALGRAQHGPLSGAGGGRRTATAHQPPEVRHAGPASAPMGRGWPSFPIATALPGPCPRPGRRRAGQGHLAAERRGRIRVDRRPDRARHLRGLARRHRTRRTSRPPPPGPTTSCSTAIGTPGRTAAARTSSWRPWTAARRATSPRATATCRPGAWGGPTTSASPPTARRSASRGTTTGSRPPRPTPTSSWSPSAGASRSGSRQARATTAPAATARTEPRSPSAPRCAAGTNRTAGACSSTNGARERCGT